MARLVPVVTGEGVRLFSTNGEDPRPVGWLAFDAEVPDMHAVQVAAALADLHEIAHNAPARRGRPPKPVEARETALEAPVSDERPRGALLVAVPAPNRFVTYNGRKLGRNAVRILNYARQHPGGWVSTEAASELRIAWAAFKSARATLAAGDLIRKVGNRRDAVWYPVTKTNPG